MKVVLFLVAVPLLANEFTERMLDVKLSQSQRNDACFSLRGDPSPAAVAAATKGMRDGKVRTCAVENLRRANAIEPLKAALTDNDPEVRAAAAQVLGTFERPELAPLIAKAGDDTQMLVATNAIEGLSNYRDKTAVPYFLQLAKKPGIVGSLAMEQLIRLKESKAVEMAREMMKESEPSRLMSAMRILGSMGDESDIAVLEAVGKRFPEPLSNRGRGFGFMPPISLGRAAESSIQQIRGRVK